MRILNIIALMLLWVMAPGVQAGPDGDALSNCLVQSSTEADKLKLVKWMFTAMALHPAVAELAQVDAAVRATANQEMADLLVDLLELRCLEPAKAALASEGPLALQASFAMLGQVAANELFSNPDVAAGLGSLTSFLDSAELERTFGIGGN